MRTRIAISASAVVLLSASLSQAASIDLSIGAVDKGAVLPDRVSNDILITTDDILRGQQMILELTAGSIYQNSFGGNAPPGAALFPLAPELAFDTFVAAGTRQADMTRPVLIVGGAVDLQPGASQKFDTEGLNIAWAPGTGVDIPPGADIPMARITLSDDAMGSLRYFSSTADGTEMKWQGHTALTVMNGIITLPVGDAPPLGIDTDLGDVANAVINHVFTIATGDPPITWSNLTLTSPVAPAIAPTLSSDGSFEWHTIGSARPQVYSWNATATNEAGSDLVSLRLNLIGGVDENMAPVAAHSDLGDIGLDIINHTFTATDDGPQSELTWSNLTVTEGSPAIAATLTPQGEFQWLTFGSLQSDQYTFQATVTDAGGLSDVGSLTFSLFPERAPVAIDAHLGSQELGSVITHAFATSTGTEPIQWSDLVVAEGSPAQPASLTADGGFTWDSSGSPEGVYAFEATASNLFGSDMARLTLSLGESVDIPEPSSAWLLGALVMAVTGCRRERNLQRN